MKSVVSLIKKSSLNKNHLKELDNKGFIIIENAEYMKKNLHKLKKKSEILINLEKDKGGWEGKEQYYKKGKKFESGADRLGGLVSKGNEFLGLIKIPEIIHAAKHVTKKEIKVCGLNLRNPKKKQGKQSIHIDGFARSKRKEKYAGIVAFIYLDDTKIRNGAMRIVPGTHKKLGWPEKYINVMKKHKNEKMINVKAGTIVVANLNLWHGGSNNISGKDRKMIMINIKNRKLPQLINYKKYLSKKVKNTLNDYQKYLLAVRNNDPTQKEDSIGVGKFYKDNFNVKNYKN